MIKQGRARPRLRIAVRPRLLGCGPGVAAGRADRRVRTATFESGFSESGAGGAV